MNESGHHDLVVKSNCAQRIISAYNNNLLWAFGRWRNQMNKRDTHLRMA